MSNIDAFTRRQGDGWTRCVLFPKKGTSYRDIHGLIVTMCCSQKLLNFAPSMKETSLFWVIQTCHVFLLFGVEAGVISFSQSFHFSCPTEHQQVKDLEDWICVLERLKTSGWFKGKPKAEIHIEGPHPFLDTCTLEGTMSQPPRLDGFYTSFGRF